MGVISDIALVLRLIGSIIGYVVGCKEYSRLEQLNEHIDKLKSTMEEVQFTVQSLGDVLDDDVALTDRLRKCHTELMNINQFIGGFNSEGRIKSCFTKKRNKNTMAKFIKDIQTNISCISALLICAHIRITISSTNTFEDTTKLSLIPDGKVGLITNNMSDTPTHAQGYAIWNSYAAPQEADPVIVKKFAPENVEKAKREIVINSKLSKSSNYPILGFRGYYLEGENNYHLVFERTSRSLSEFLQKNEVEDVNHEWPVWYYVWKWAKLIASALREIHSNGVVHQDVRAENIMVFDDLGKDFEVKLANFGLDTNPNPAWAPPEFLDAYQECTCTKESDVFSYGSFLYEIASEKPPFSEEHTCMPELPVTWPEKYRNIIEKCWMPRKSRPCMDPFDKTCGEEFEKMKKEREEEEEKKQREQREEEEKKRNDKCKKIYEDLATVPKDEFIYMYENQRFTGGPFGSWRDAFLPTDRSPYTPYTDPGEGIGWTSLNDVELERIGQGEYEGYRFAPSSSWEKIVDDPMVDSEGWKYALDFPRSYDKNDRWYYAVRRRRWIRKIKKL